MALYIKPPKGNIGFNKLCDLIKKRLNFLSFIKGKSYEEINARICGEALISDSECVIDGSIKDRVSHFVLRYLCAGHSGLQAFFIQSETDLFVYRLKFYDFLAIEQLLQDALKQTLSVFKCQNIIKPYINILQVLIDLGRNFDIALNNNFNLKVPFTAALNIVQRRLFPLNSGFIEIPPSDIKLLLPSIFEEVVSQGIKQTKSVIDKEDLKDSRVNYMEKEIIKWFDSHICNSINGLRSSFVLEGDLNNQSKIFPLCMANLHFLLRKNHRLPHNSRVQYILFLKEIGMPFPEVISLFRKEYSTPLNEKNSKNSCSHSWSGHENRYVYSIEHLYGKRGSRKNYDAHSCYSLQTLGSLHGSSGGCPFTCFDEKNVHGFFNSSLEDIEDLKSLASENKYAKACQLYLLKKVSMSCTSINMSMLRQKIDDASGNHSSGFVKDCNMNLNNVTKKCFITKDSIQRTLMLKTLDARFSKPSEVYFMFKNFTQ